MNILELRSGIEAALGGFLGTYILPNTATTPAIAVRPAGQGLAPGTTVTGIEAVILQDPTPIPVRQYQNELSLHEWTLFLVDWDNGNTLQQVANELIYAYPGAVVTPVQVPLGVGPRSQMQVRIQDYEAVRIQAGLAALLLESGGYLLLESGGKLLLE